MKKLLLSLSLIIFTTQAMDVVDEEAPPAGQELIDIPSDNDLEINLHAYEDLPEEKDPSRPVLFGALERKIAKLLLDKFCDKDEYEEKNALSVDERKTFETLWEIYYKKACSRFTYTPGLSYTPGPTLIMMPLKCLTDDEINHFRKKINSLENFNIISQNEAYRKTLKILQKHNKTQKETLNYTIRGLEKKLDSTKSHWWASIVGIFAVEIIVGIIVYPLL